MSERFTSSAPQPGLIRRLLTAALAASLALSAAAQDDGSKAPKKKGPKAPKAVKDTSIEDFVARHVQHVEDEALADYLDDFLLSDEQRAILHGQAERLFAEYDFDITIESMVLREKSPRHAKIELTQRTRLSPAEGEPSETLILLTLHLRKLDGQWYIAATDRTRLEPDATP